MVEEEGDEQEEGEVSSMIHKKCSQSIGHDEPATSGEVLDQAHFVATLVAKALFATHATARSG